VLLEFSQQDLSLNDSKQSLEQQDKEI